ncbi:MAG TPA: efflux RND transporter permease subunit, partial [Chitinophagales bacterium]|nr:efflux RND transporter permease subunit [Chitinophagales bacterium]
CSILLNKNVKEKHNPVVSFFENGIRKLFTITYEHKRTSIIVSLVFMTLCFASFKFLGTEFLPKLDEGALWVKGDLAMSASLEESNEIANKMCEMIKQFPEVNETLAQIGRTNDGTDPKGFYHFEIAVDLKPKSTWAKGVTPDNLVDKMDKQLSKIPGVILNYSQPIRDNVEEAVAGVPASLVVKIFGEDFEVLDTKADSILNILKTVRGCEDLGVLRNLGQPEFRIELDQQKMAIYGVNTADANSVIEMALGGKAATQLYENERKFDIRIRYQKSFRNSDDKIGNLMIPTMSGAKIPLRQISNIKTLTGPAFIYRDNNMRYIAVKFSVRDRDLGSTIVEAQKKVEKQVHLSKGYTLSWNGEFENQQRASNTLM